MEHVCLRERERQRWGGGKQRRQGKSEAASIHNCVSVLQNQVVHWPIAVIQRRKGHN